MLRLERWSNLCLQVVDACHASPLRGNNVQRAMRNFTGFLTACALWQKCHSARALLRRAALPPAFPPPRAGARAGPWGGRRRRRVGGARALFRSPRRPGCLPRYRPRSFPLSLARSACAGRAWLQCRPGAAAAARCRRCRPRRPSPRTARTTRSAAACGPSRSRGAPRRPAASFQTRWPSSTWASGAGERARGALRMGDKGDAYERSSGRACAGTGALRLWGAC